MIISVFIFTTFGFATLKDKEFEIVKNLEIFYSVFSELDRFYVDETNPGELIESAINGMLSSLDPYTTYIPEEDIEDFNFMTTGEYGGIGAYIRKADEYAIISEPYEGFPAQTNGLLAGDTIISIDGIPVKGKDITNVSDLLKGAPNTNVELRIRRMGTDGEIDKKVLRQKITVPNVPYYGIIGNNTGYLRLTNFTRDAGLECRNALTQLKKSGATSIILDLRGNPGGLLVEAVNVANVFIRNGQEVVSTRGKVKQWDGVYRTTSEPVDTIIPVVVLVSSSSASASEIVAGALQDLDRAVILGQKTFGKGLVQTTRPVTYNSELKVTTAKYYIPSGRCIQAVDYSHRNPDGSVGLVPDSLIRQFVTSNGRIVYDGGGIAPDIPIEPETVGNITLSLFAKNLIFDYATLYYFNKKVPSSPGEVSLSDEDYREFINFLKDKDYDYITESDQILNELIEVARQEDYYKLAVDEFSALQVKLAHDKEKDLMTFSSEIRSLLEQEIASRYFYQKGRIQSSLKDDNEVAKALEILANPKTYASILNVPGVNFAANR